MTYRNTVTNDRGAAVKVLAFLARLLGAILSLIVDARRVKCRNHVLSPRTYPPQCLECFETK